MTQRKGVLSKRFDDAAAQTRKPRSAAGRRVWAAALAEIWFWAAGLLASRDHLVENYFVIASAPRVWGWIALDLGRLLLLIAAAGGLAWLLDRAARRVGGWTAVPHRWLAAAVVIPALDLARAAGVAIPYTFFEPLLLATVSGLAVAAACDSEFVCSPVAAAARWWRPGMGRAAVWVAAIAAGAWFFYQSQSNYDDFLLGFHDFGHFAWRVASTWSGRGFLQETPSLPAFWDHFNPGLALLAPLWGAWPDARLFLLLQAICLALPAPIVYSLARAWRADDATAALWSLAYLLYPATSQWNLSYSYGWHPVSVALPLLLLAVWGVASRRRVLAAAAALLACSFQETIFVLIGCLAFAMVAQRSLTGEFARPPTGDRSADTTPLAARLPRVAWLTIWLAMIAAFAAAYRWAGFAEFQSSRFANLGESPLRVALSPLLNPREFWGQVLRPASVWFLLCLALPLGLRSLIGGRWILLAAAPHVIVLLAWNHTPATSIAFQYSLELSPLLFTAAISGAAVLNSRRRALIAATTCGVASLFFGAWPWSSDSQKVLLAETYRTAEGLAVENPRAVGTSGHAALTAALDQADDPQAAVLATGRAASHLLRVRRLEPVDEACKRWPALVAEAEYGRSGIEVFDWVLLDTDERFQQSRDDINFMLGEARRAGYREVSAGHGIVLLARPTTPLRQRQEEQVSP